MDVYTSRERTRGLGVGSTRNFVHCHGQTNGLRVCIGFTIDHQGGHSIIAAILTLTCRDISLEPVLCPVKSFGSSALILMKCATASGLGGE